MEERDEMIHHYFTELEAQCMKMNGWEENFVDSVMRQYGDGKDLTDKQFNKLTDIYEKVTSR